MLKIDVTGFERWVGFDSVDFFSYFDNIDKFEITREKCTGKMHRYRRLE